MSKISSGSLTVVDVKGGSDGINTATIYLYQRAKNAPEKPQSNITYTFNTATVSGGLGSWQTDLSQLTGTNPIWVIAAVAHSNGASDVISPNEWVGPTKLAQDGTDGEPGEPGAPGTPGLNQATVFIYKRASSVTKPSNSTYTFATGNFTVDGNWEKTIPTATTENRNPCWVCSAVAIGSGNTAELVWSNPSLLVENGSDGLSPIVTQLTNGVKIVDAEGNETFITNGSNGQSYYTHVRYSENADGSNYVTTPTSDTIYVGIYSGLSSTAPPYNDSGWTWSRYIGTAGNDGDDGISVTGIKEVYFLTTGAAPAQSTLPNGTEIISTSTASGQWTTAVPTYIVNGKYYTSIQTSLDKGTSPIFSNIVLNQGLTDANKNAYDASIDASEAKELSQATQQHFWFNAVKTGNIEAGAYITDVVIDSFKPNKSGNYLLAGSNGIELGNGSHPYMQLTATELNFFHPNNNTIDAQLSSNGLVVKSGGIEAGTVGQDGGIYLSTKNYGITHNNQAITINGHEAKNWRQIIGTKFGVDSDGVLYAGGANIQGKITVTSGSNVYTTDDVNPLDVGGRNLIISFTTTIGSILNSSGELIDNPRGVVSDLIEVQPNEKYILQYWLPNNLTDTGTDRAWNCKICWYNQEETASEETTGETYISGYMAEYFSDYKVYFGVAPTNAKYCRVCFELPASYQNGEVSQEWINGDDGYRWKLEQGTIATDWTLAPEDTNNIAEQQDLYLITDNETTTEGALYHYLNDNDELVSQVAEWSPTYQSPDQYNPYIWWKYILTYSSGQIYESTPVIFNSIPQGQIDELTQQINNHNSEINDINNVTVNLGNQYNSLSTGQKKITNQLANYEKNITIDSKMPMIKVYSRTATEESSVTVYSNNVIIKGGGNTTTEINSEGLKTNIIETQTLMPKNNNIGHLAFIARQNGHLSLKVVT